MGTHLASIEVSADLVLEIDKEVGQEQRAAFVTEAAEDALRRRRLRSFIDDARKEPAWKDENHPELADGAYAWVRKLREENELRMRSAEAAWEKD